MADRGRSSDVFELPPRILNFVNRDSERSRAVRAVDEWHEPFRPLCLGLTGPHGGGKLTLAYEVLRGRQRRYSDVVLIDLKDFRQNGAVDSDETVKYLLAKLGAAPEWPGGGSDDCHGRWRTRTRHAEIAIIVRNAWFESEVTPLLPASGGSAVIVTSDRPLSDLEAGAAVLIPVAPLEEKHGIELLVRAVGDPRRLTEDSPAAGDIVRLCGGLPLVIRAAARFIRRHPRLSLRAVLDSFAKDLREKGFPEMDQIWDAAYESLDDGAARLYRLLAVAPGTTFTLRLAAALLGRGPDDTALAVDELEAAGLLAGTEDETEEDTEDETGAEDERMSLPVPVLAHAKRREAGHENRAEITEALRRAVSWVLRQAQRMDEGAAGSRLTRGPRVDPVPGVEDVPLGDADSAYRWLETEHRTLCDCVSLAYRLGMDTEAWSLCEPLFTHYQDHPHYADTLEAFGTGLEAAQRAEDVPAVIRMRSQLAFLYRDHRKFDLAWGEITQALAASRALSPTDKDDRKLAASVIEFRGRLREDEGRLAEAVADFTEVLRVHEAIGNAYGVMLASYRLGRVEARNGEPERAVERLEEARRLAASDERKRMTGRTAVALAEVLRGLGQTDRPRELYLEALKNAHERSSAFDEARILDALAALAEETGDPAGAAGHRSAAKAIRDRNGVSS